MERFAKIVNDFSALTIFVKYFILDVSLGSEYPLPNLQKQKVIYVFENCWILDFYLHSTSPIN